MNKGHYNHFDQEDLPEGHKKRMHVKLDQAFGKESGVSLPGWLKVAAVFMVVSLGTWGTYYYLRGDKEVASIQEEYNTIPIEQAEQYFKHSFKTQFNLLSAHKANPESKEMIEATSEMISELDLQYKKLEMELRETGDQRVAAAMINNYKKRIEILEKLIQKIEYVNQLKSNKDETPSA